MFLEDLRDLLNEKREIFVDIVLDMIIRNVREKDFKKFLKDNWKARHYTKEVCKQIDSIRQQAMKKKGELQLSEQKFSFTASLSPGSQHINQKREKTVVNAFIKSAEVNPFEQVK